MTSRSPGIQPAMSLVIPTRERATYLEYALQSCTRSAVESLEILVLDNASTDGTADVVRRCPDKRIRYVRTDSRLSMRDNFERGLEESRGNIICMLGDDDAILPKAAETVLQLMQRHDISAVSCHRAFYGWPDLGAGRSSLALVPRASGVDLLSSREEVRHVLESADYYRLPCLYHGFVKREPVEIIRKRQGRFFLSNNTDIYSAISLSMEGMKYAYSKSPLIVNGGSARSNGASHYGGAPELEKNLWKKEDDLGFLPGFSDTVSVNTAIVETALRFCKANGKGLNDIFDRPSLIRCLAIEVKRRRAIGRPQASSDAMLAEAGVSPEEIAACSAPLPNRAMSLVGSYRRTTALNMESRGVGEVDAAAQCIQSIVDNGRTGMLDYPVEQIRSAIRLAIGR